MKAHLFRKYFYLSLIVIFIYGFSGKCLPSNLDSGRSAFASLIYSSMAPPTTLVDSRLRDLEAAAGIQHYVWEMNIPKGACLVVHFWGGDSGKSGKLDDFTFKIRGPVKPSYENRLSLALLKSLSSAAIP